MARVRWRWDTEGMTHTIEDMESFVEAELDRQRDLHISATPEGPIKTLVEEQWGDESLRKFIVDAAVEMKPRKDGMPDIQGATEWVWKLMAAQVGLQQAPSRQGRRAAQRKIDKLSRRLES